jgi:peroxiredoxin
LADCYVTAILAILAILAMSKVSPLTTAPPFTLPTQKGDTRSLADFLEKEPVLLAFHRGTW